MTDTILDPWAAAASATPTSFSSDIFGQIEFDPWFCVLQKGVGKVPFDPAMHRPNERRTAISINLTDVGGVNFTRDFIAEIAADGWLKVTLPSLQALGVTDLQKFSGSYVHAVMEPYGEYTDRDGNKKQRTAPKVLAVYPSREACEAAAQISNPQTDWLTNPKPAATPNGNGANDAERAVALSFLPAIVKGCVAGNGVDSVKLEEALKGNPILARHFNIGSPEVIQAIAAALAEPAF